MQKDLAHQPKSERQLLAIMCPEHQQVLVPKLRGHDPSKGTFMGCPTHRETGCDFTVHSSPPYIASGEVAETHGLKNVEMEPEVVDNPSFSPRAERTSQTKEKMQQVIDQFVQRYLQKDLDRDPRVMLDILKKGFGKQLPREPTVKDILSSVARVS